MLIDEQIHDFLLESDFFGHLELEKLALLAYFHWKAAGTVEFGKREVADWFNAVGTPQPNWSRLREKCRKSKDFITLSGGAAFKLHKMKLDQLEADYAPVFGKSADRVLRVNSGAFVDASRISELKKIGASRFDFSKVIQICTELNQAYASASHLSLIMLTRALIDHVPPVFGASKFSEVVDNYRGSRSFKDSMRGLNASSRKIADQQLHTQIRDSESLPTLRQVDFSHDIDVLLAEMIRISK